MPKKKTGWTPSDISFAVIGSLLALGVLVLVGIPIWNAIKPETDPTKLLVRKWLKENLEDGQWEEVKWYPARTVQGLYDLNLLHIIEAVERDKQAFEKGTGKEDHRSEYQKLYNKVRETGPRTFCAMKLRTTTLNGQAKNLRKQAFEIVNDEVKPLASNEIKEVTSHLIQNANSNYLDGWKYFEDRDYHPFPEDPIEGLEQRFQAALTWKTPVVQAPVTPAEIKPKEIEKVATVKQIPDPERSVPETMPPEVRDYFDRETKSKMAEVEILEKRIEQLDNRLRTAKPSQISGLENQIRQIKDEIAETRRKRFTAPLPDRPIVGDMGAMPNLEVLETVDAETALALWHPNGKGRLPKIEVIIHPIETSTFGDGDAALQVELFKVTATRDEPSETMAKLIEAGKKPEFVVGQGEMSEITKWRLPYEKEMRSKESPTSKNDLPPNKNATPTSKNTKRR